MLYSGVADGMPWLKMRVCHVMKGTSPGVGGWTFGVFGLSGFAKWAPSVWHVFMCRIGLPSVLGNKLTNRANHFSSKHLIQSNPTR